MLGRQQLGLLLRCCSSSTTTKTTPTLRHSDFACIVMADSSDSFVPVKFIRDGKSCTISLSPSATIDEMISKLPKEFFVQQSWVVLEIGGNRLSPLIHERRKGNSNIIETFSFSLTIMQICSNTIFGFRTGWSLIIFSIGCG